VKTFVSLFAGVGGFDLGFEQAGMDCIGQVEIDPKCQEILQKHWPDIPRHDDVTTAIDWANEYELVGRTDVVCGGFPCQDVSVAGKRAGLAGERTGLFWDALAFATHVQAKWIVLENVPGLLTSNQGRDFGTILLALADAGYVHLEWRVLDSQFFGVPQRRRRVFLVGCTSVPSQRPILTESEGGSGNPPKGGKTGEEVAGTLGGGASLSGWACDTDRMTFVPYVKARRAQNDSDYETWVDGRVTPTLNAFDNATESRATVVGVMGTVSHTLTSEGADASEDGSGRGTPVVAFGHKQGLDVQASEFVTPTLRSNGNGAAVAYNQASASEYQDSQVSMSMTAAQAKQAVTLVNSADMRVRRLTPMECERLQGFPDDWTAGIADTHRYKQMGNAVTVNVAAYVGKLIGEA
jgi:DNA (cytosine-5)-methyltransferase 1